MSPACTRVFETPELLEAILARLPPRDLLHAQRVSHGFQSIIKTSPKLQQALFFRPAPFKNSKSWTLNPLLRDLFLPWFIISENRWQLPEHDTLRLLDWSSSERTREAMLYSDASWRRMLLIQPPPKELLIDQYIHGQGGDDCATATVSFEDKNAQGVTMDILYDIPVQFLSRHTVSQFGLAVKESKNSPPQIRLCLLFTIQCCGDDHKGNEFRSKAEKPWNLKDLKFVRPKPHIMDNVFGRRIKMEWTTDLTSERGGILDHEFEKWSRERAPISSLLSDVR